MTIRHSWRLTTPYGKHGGQGTLTVERDIEGFARLSIRLGDSHLTVAIAAPSSIELLTALHRVQESDAELRAEGRDPFTLELVDEVAS